MRNKEGLVDDLITSIPGEWKFDEQVSQHFDTHVRKSVPLYEEVQKAVIEIRLCISGFPVAGECRRLRIGNQSYAAHKRLCQSLWRSGSG